MLEIQYDARWSDEVDEKFLSDFLSLQREVFNCGSIEEYKRQYDANPYGKSIIVVAYFDGKPVGARSLWRNDIYNRESYQPGSTCVSSSYRGLGIFRDMTLKALSMIPSDAIIYNFPNQNSYPGYIKMGWKMLFEYYPRLFVTYNQYHSEHPIIMDDEYARWWVIGSNQYYKKIHGHFFLLHKDRRFLCYRIFAEVSESIAIQFQKAKMGFVFYNSSIRPPFFRHFTPSHVVIKNSIVEYVPAWKIDSI